MIDDFNNRPSSGGDTPKRDEFMPDLSTPKRSPGAEISPVDDGDINPFENLESDPKLPKVQLQPEATMTSDNTDVPKPPKRRWWHRVTGWFRGLSKKQKALVIVGVVLLLIGGGVGVYALLHEPPAPPVTRQKPEPEPEPLTVANTLTGRQVDREINQRQVTAVIIENSQAARPQAGLQEAGVVFEAIAEGGVTRFLALYQDTDPKSIGPVRSLRPYYLSWAQGFDSAVAHVGGSPEALQQVRNRNTKDLDQFSGAGYFQRVTDRYAPHNVFTSISQLRKFQDSKGYKSSEFTGFDRLEEQDEPAPEPAPPIGSAQSDADEPAGPPAATTIQVNISSGSYNTAYAYDKKTNTYKRSMGGVPHKDKVSDKQITPDVVVVMTMNYGIHANGTHSVYNTVGQGQVRIFQNGEVLTGTWRKSSHDGQITFTDADGERIKLQPGQTWIAAIASSDRLTYRP